MPGVVTTYVPGSFELVVTPVADAAACLTELQKRIAPGYLEIVPRWRKTADGRACWAFCHEHSKIDGMPINHAAQMLWLHAQLQHYGDRLNDTLCGPVCVVTGDKKFLESL